MPILDSMTYQEELIDFPDDHDFREPGSSLSLPRTAILSGTLVIGDKMDSSSQETLWRMFMSG